MLKRMFLLWMLVVLPGLALAEDFVAGKDYVVIQNPPKAEQTGKAVEIIEFFSYGCPWCYRLEGGVEQWVAKKGAAIHFDKVPVVYNPDWEYYAKAYYTAKALSLSKTCTPALFKAIIVDKEKLNSNQAMIDFFVKQGADKKLVQSAFLNSPSIDLAVSNSKTLMGDYQINGVPSFVVANQYKTDLQMTQSEARLLAVLDFLVAKAHQAK